MNANHVHINQNFVFYCLPIDNCSFASYESEGVCVQSCPDGLVADDDPRVCRNTTGECTCTYVPTYLHT